MDPVQQAGIHEALVALQHAVATSLSRCDQEDLGELIERVEAELSSERPNKALLGTFLNSIARSLRTEPGAREVCLAIEDAIDKAGIPSTWQSGI
jgi:hypothetical protein